MQKLMILFLSVVLSGCSLASITLFQDFSEDTANTPKPAEQFIKEDANATPSVDYYGRPIYSILIEGKSTDYGQGLYHALSRSLERNPNGLFLIVAYGDTEGNAGNLATAISDYGIPMENISIKTESATDSKEVRLYER